MVSPALSPVLARVYHWLAEPTATRRWHLATLYIVVVVTATLYVQIFGVPFVEGR